MVRFPWAVALVAAAPFVSAADDPKPAPDLKAATAFARKVERAVKENEAKSFSGFFDGKTLTERALKDLPAPPGFRSKFDSMADTFGTRLFGEIVRKTSDTPGGGMTLLRVRVVDGEPRALYRNLTPEGLNYLDVVLSKDAGPVRIVDIYVALSGEFISRTIQRVATKALADLQDNKDKPAGLAESIENLEQMSRFTSLVRSGKAKEALEVWAKLSAATKREKLVMLMHVVATAARMEEDQAAYQRSIEAFTKRFPTDPAVNLVSLDGFLLKKKFTEFQAAVDRLDQSVGGDPYLHVLRGNGHAQAGKMAEAKKAIAKAIQEEPTLIAAYLALADVALLEKDWKELARVLTVLEAKHKIDFSGVETVDEYAEFRKTPEYREWLARRAKKADGP